MHWRVVESCGNHVLFLIVNRMGQIWWIRIISVRLLVLRSLEHHILHRDHLWIIIIDRWLITKIDRLQRSTNITGSVVKTGGYVLFALMVLVYISTVESRSVFVYIHQLTVFFRPSIISHVIQGLIDILKGYVSGLLLVLISVSILAVWTLSRGIQPRLISISLSFWMQWVSQHLIRCWTKGLIRIQVCDRVVAYCVIHVWLWTSRTSIILVIYKSLLRNDWYLSSSGKSNLLSLAWHVEIRLHLWITYDNPLVRIFWLLFAEDVLSRHIVVWPRITTIRYSLCIGGIEDVQHAAFIDNASFGRIALLFLE